MYLISFNVSLGNIFVMTVAVYHRVMTVAVYHRVL